MSPIEIRVLLHYYYSPVQWGEVEQVSHAASNAIWNLTRSGLLTYTNNGAAITERGRVHVEALKNLSLPVPRTVWETPK